jgi:hypothetical protein
MAKGRKATIADAELCIKLFELRREAEMRKARDFVNFKFQPTCADDVLKLMLAFGTQENAWFRQVFSFWENVASLAVHDVVHPDLFLAWNGEMVFVYAKFAPYLKEMREAMDSPQFLSNVQKVVTGSMEMRKRLAHVQKMQARFASAAQAAKAK